MRHNLLGINVNKFTRHIQFAIVTHHWVTHCSNSSSSEGDAVVDLAQTVLYHRRSLGWQHAVSSLHSERLSQTRVTACNLEETIPVRRGPTPNACCGQRTSQHVCKAEQFVLLQPCHQLLQLVSFQHVASPGAVAGVVGELHRVQRADIKAMELQWEGGTLVANIAKDNWAKDMHPCFSTPVWLAAHVTAMQLVLPWLCMLRQCFSRMLSFVVSPELLPAAVAAVGAVLVPVSGCVVSPLLLPVAVLPVAMVEVLATTSAHASLKRSKLLVYTQ